MDKEEYETYEYLPNSVTTTEPEQYFIMQDDGTFLGVNKELISQAEPVYDVPPQIYFLNIDSTPDLVPAPQQFILPESTNNYYESNFVYQSENVEDSEMQEDVIDKNEITAPGLEDSAEMPNTQAEGLTEITLSDEQYQTLEKKGWLLLEENDKTYVLDTLGLHDITSNSKLIEQLKNDTATIVNELSNTVNLPAKEEVENILNDEIDIKEENSNSQLDDKATEEKELEIDEMDKHDDDINTEIVNGDPKLLKVNENTHELSEKNRTKMVKLKTSLIFKDIPDKILLGKTAEGKNIYAKLRKEPKTNVDPSEPTVTLPKTVIDDTTLSVALMSKLQSRVSDDEDLAIAEQLVQQLMKVTSLKALIIDEDLLITKVHSNEEKYPLIVMTGKIKTHLSNWSLNPKPEIIRNILNLNNGRNANTENDDNPSYVVHIHAFDAEHPDGTTKTSITVNRKPIPIQIKCLKDKNSKVNTLKYGCGGCAAIFLTLEDLETHRETNWCNRKSESNSPEPSPMEISEETMDSTENTKNYKCNICDVQFKHPATLSRHIVKYHIARNTSKYKIVASFSLFYL